MLYEFSLAQTLTLMLGQTSVRYPLTIGLYTAALGFGSLFYKKIFNSKGGEPIFQFIRIEIMITLISITAFVLFYTLSSTSTSRVLSSYGIEDTHINIFTQIFSHLMVFLIGTLNGAELPLLMEISENNKGYSPLRILAADYLGTLLASIIFPLVLLPNFHLLWIITFAATLNLFSSAFLFIYSKFKLSNL